MTLRRLFALLTALGAALAVALPVGAQAPPAGREVRLIVTAFKQELSQAESYEAFRAAVFDHFDTHVAPLLADHKPNLVVYPERLDRIASLIGLRGQAARGQLADGADPGTARLALYGPYAPQIAYYRSQFDGLADTQYLQLALTDTVVRSVVETFSEVAKRGGAHVVVGSALPAYEEATGPEAAVLADPGAGGGAAYVATQPEVYAQTLVIGADGAVVAQRPKIYLDGGELNAAVTNEGLTPGAPSDVDVVDLPFASVGVVAGQDAQMPDLAARLDLLDAEVLVQPRSGGPWAVFTRAPSLWPPDQFRRGAWLSTQRHPSLGASATGVLTGHLGSAVSDGQPAIAAPSAAIGGCLVGAGRQPGWAAVGPWTGLDLSGDECAIDRREELTEVAAALAPGSGDEGEGAYAHGAVAADVILPSRGSSQTARVPHGGFGTSRPMPGEAEQGWPALDIGASGARLAWVDASDGDRRVMVASSEDGGAWSEPDVVWPLSSPAVGHTNDQSAPALLALDVVDREGAPGLSVAPAVDAYAAFPVLGGFDWDVYSSRYDPAEETWGSRQRVDRGRSGSFFGDDEDVLRAHAEPVLLEAADGTMVAVWSDLRWPYVSPQVRVATAAGGEGWAGRQRVDGGPEDPDIDSASQPEALEPGETRSQVAPTAALTGTGDLLVAWQEPSPEGTRSIYLARSSDLGGSFETPVRVDGTSSASFRPVLAAAGETVWLAWEDETLEGGYRLLVRRSTDAGRNWTPAEPLDPTAPAQAQQSRAAAAADGDQATFVFEDDRAGDADVLAVTLGPTGAPVPTQRVDDGPDGANARAPDVAVLADVRWLVAWQDDRDGVDHVRTAVRAPINVAQETQEAQDATSALVTPSPVPLPATGGGAVLGVLGALLALVATRLTQNRP